MEIEPGTEVEPGGEVEPEGNEPEPFVLPEDFASQVQAWDIDLAEIPEAVQQFKALKTEEGVIDSFIAHGQALGFGIKEMQRLFADDEPQAPAAPAPSSQVEEPDPDELLSRAEVNRMLEEIRNEQKTAQEQAQEREFQARQQETFRTIDAWFEANGITDQDERRSIANFGERHLQPGQDGYDPRVVTQLLEAGRADHEAYVDRAAKAYLERKARAAGNQPTPVGGAPASTTGSQEPEFTYEGKGQGALEAAKQRVRDRLKAAQES